MMAYDPSDRRSALKTADPGVGVSGVYAGAEYVKFYERDPEEASGGARTWYARGQNMVICYTAMSDGYSFSRVQQPDEYVILLPDKATTATVTIDGQDTTVEGKTMIVVPPGDSSVRVSGQGQVIGLFSDRASDLAAKASNADSYTQAHPNVAPLVPWPEPTDGYRLRTYSLEVPALGNPPFRLFRCTTFMVNYFDPRTEPRPLTQLSPHHHNDFEQCSLVLEGEYVHHLRWPWGTDGTTWREDDHELCGAPSVTIIPPPSIHTSQATGPNQNLLIDIFAPPRTDFSEMDGWVLNANEYPTPTQ